MPTAPNPDFLVIGAGVAGMRAAIELAQAGPVLVIAKDTLHESSSEYAQGGIAVALGDDDEVELHEQDTIAAGDGLCDLQAVRTLVEQGPAAIQQLIEWGAEFDGVAMAWRAGAVITDIEFVQFHPTALHVEGAPRFLLSEALRGEGAHLLNARGERFMHRYHPLEELAPRDVVSRAIVAELRATNGAHVFLDLHHRGGDFIRARFPRIYQT